MHLFFTAAKLPRSSLPPPLRSPSEGPALTAAVAHSARPRPMVTPVSCFQCSWNMCPGSALHAWCSYAGGPFQDSTALVLVHSIPGSSYV